MYGVPLWSGIHTELQKQQKVNMGCPTQVAYQPQLLQFPDEWKSRTSSHEPVCKVSTLKSVSSHLGQGCGQGPGLFEAQHHV